MKKRVLLIGAAGRIGNGFLFEYLDKGYSNKYELILGVHNKKFKDSRFKVRFISLEDKRSLNRAMKNINIVVNLAANSSPYADFDDLISPNIVGVYNVFECAVKNNVKRVIFASSVHAVYDNLGKTVNSMVFPKPSDLYGATKVFGESLCYVFSRNYNLSCFAIRIGAYTSLENMKSVCYSRKDYHHVISQRDMGQLLHRAIVSSKKIKFGIFSGVSKNKKMDMSLSEAKRILKYSPRDDAYDLCRNIKLKK